MINRVLKERRQKADKATYRIQLADNIFGDHFLTNEKGARYKVFLRDFDRETGYSNSLDSQLNKLGTTKHIMFALRLLKKSVSGGSIGSGRKAESRPFSISLPAGPLKIKSPRDCRSSKASLTACLATTEPSIRLISVRRGVLSLFSNWRHSLRKLKSGSRKKSNRMVCCRNRKACL